MVLIHLRETEMSPSENFSPPPESVVLDIGPSLHLHMVKMAPLPSFWGAYFHLTKLGARDDQGIQIACYVMTHCETTDQPQFIMTDAYYIWEITESLFVACVHSHCLSLTLTLSYSPTFTLIISHTNSHTLSHSHPHSLLLSNTLTLILSHTHSHTLLHSHALMRVRVGE